MKYSIPRGTFDILPADSYKWQYLKASFRRIATSFGYAEISTPVFETADLFERSSGESSDVVKKEMYRFTDRKGREFALRPEGTAPVVRSFVENHLDVLNSRTKLFYIGPMFRYDRPQAGRYRQFYQYGIEFIGSNHPYYDAEVIALEMLWLKDLGLKNLRLEINSVGCSSCASDYDQALRDFFRPLLPKLCPDCVQRFEIKPRRLLDCKVPSASAYVKVRQCSLITSMMNVKSTSNRCVTTWIIWALPMSLIPLSCVVWITTPTLLLKWCTRDWEHKTRWPEVADTTA